MLACARGTRDARMKFEKSIQKNRKNRSKNRAKNFFTEKSGIILKFFDAFTAAICLRHVAPLSDATLT
jgi:hypothetical protein